jgi:hypothetical protein
VALPDWLTMGVVGGVVVLAVVSVYLFARRRD